MCHNPHNVIHIAGDVLEHGNLDCFSAFSFENHLQSVKKLMRKPETALAQVVRRLTEIEMNSLHNSVNVHSPTFSGPCHDNGPTLIDCNGIQYSDARWQSWRLKCKEPNNCVIMNDNSVVIIRNFVESKKRPFIIGEKFSRIDDSYNSPIKSSCIGTVLVSNFGTLKSWPLSNIKCKAILSRTIFHKDTTPSTIFSVSALNLEKKLYNCIYLLFCVNSKFFI